MSDKNLEKYILAHTRGEDEVLADLYRKTSGLQMQFSQ